MFQFSVYIQGLKDFCAPYLYGKKSSTINERKPLYFDALSLSKILPLSCQFHLKINRSKT